MTMLNSKCHNQKGYPCRAICIKFGQIFSMPGVLHNICNMCSCDLPNMSALTLWHVRVLTY